MAKLLKVLSVLEIIIGVLSVIGGVLIFAGSGVMAPATETVLEGQIVTIFRVTAVLGIISGIFNLACGLTGMKGAKGDEKKLNTAIVLGWIGLIAAAISAVMALYGNVNVNSIVSAIASAVVPVLFLVSAMSVKKNG